MNMYISTTMHIIATVHVKTTSPVMFWGCCWLSTCAIHNKPTFHAHLQAQSYTLECMHAHVHTHTYFWGLPLQQQPPPQLSSPSLSRLEPPALSSVSPFRAFREPFWVWCASACEWEREHMRDCVELVREWEMRWGKIPDGTHEWRFFVSLYVQTDQTELSSLFLWSDGHTFPCLSLPALSRGWRGVACSPRGTFAWLIPPYIDTNNDW